MYLWMPKSRERHSHLGYHEIMCRSSLDTHVPPFSTPACRRSHRAPPVRAGWAPLPSRLPRNHVPLQSRHPCAALPCGSCWFILIPRVSIWAVVVRDEKLWYEFENAAWFVISSVIVSLTHRMWCIRKSSLPKCKNEFCALMNVRHNWNTKKHDYWQFRTVSLGKMSKRL